MGETDAGEARGTKKGYGGHAGDDKVMETGKFDADFREKKVLGADDADSWATGKAGKSIRDNLDTYPQRTNTLGFNQTYLLLHDPRYSYIWLPWFILQSGRCCMQTDVIAAVRQH